MQYEIVDRHTNARVGQPYKDRTRASRRVDRLDNEYGAYRYYVRVLNNGCAQVLAG